MSWACDGGRGGAGGSWREKVQSQSGRLTGLGKGHRKCSVEIYGHDLKGPVSVALGFPPGPFSSTVCGDLGLNRGVVLPSE